MIDVELDLFTDIDQHLFIEKGIRGGAGMICHRYARANVPCIKNYDASKRNSYIIYLDANNLYGWAMSQLLPTSNFKWLTDEEIRLDSSDFSVTGINNVYNVYNVNSC